MVWLMKYIEKLIRRIVPSLLSSSFLTPLLIILIPGTIAVVAVGSLGACRLCHRGHAGLA